ncbi:PIR protein CIR protein [Plasmodium vinckei lentum]|uniref:PIR protein CIR protein n=1 Tax=Plasmodium vinckei lentum TaxID=138297 RepID=A0A6V7RW56_PLAVN|nr:PIR protein CIR protein [Plasmodium vinckei lentum]
MSEEVCKIFYSIDGVFKNGKPDLKKINKLERYRRYCPMDSTGLNCKDDIDGIDALCARLIDDLFQIPKDKRERENNDNQYIEYIMMWLSFRLFQSRSYSSQTLTDFYNNRIVKTHLNYGYDYDINKKKQLLDANLYYMSRLYQLFNEICHITLKYSKNNQYMKEIKNDSVRFYNNYKSLYDYINECESYLGLLNNLKAVYENLKNSLINDKRNRRYVSVISVNLKNLPHTRKANKTSTIGFDCPKCKKVNSNVEKINPKAVPKLPEPKPAGSSSQQSQKQAQKQKSETSPKKPEPAKTKAPAASQQAEQQPPSPPQQALPPEPPSTTTIQKEPPGSQGVPNSAVDQLLDQGNKPKSSDNDQRKTASEMGKQGGGIEHKQEQSPDGKQQISNPIQGNSSDGPENSGGLKNIGQKPPANGPEKQSPHSETKEPSPPETSKQEQLQTQPGPQNISESKTPQKEGSNHLNGQGDSKNETKGSGNENRNPNGGAKDPGAPSGGTGDPPSGPHSPSQDGKSDKTNPLDQAGTSNTSEESIDLWTPFFKLLLNGKDYFDKASDFIEQNRQRFNDAKDKISNVYNDTVDNLKRVYNASSIYFSGMINSITNQLNQDDTPKLGSSGNNLPQSSDQPKKIGDPLPPQPPTPPSNPPLPPPAIIPPDPSQQSQSPPQLQSTTLQSTQLDPPTQKITDNLIKSPSPKPILRTPWNIIPTTWNGSGNCKPKIKFINTTLVCCTPEQCSLTGISVTFVLIPIILLIVYKYLSFGSSKKSEKKNMKRVIKLADGSKKTKIIISSNDRSKHLKPVINSVGRKKDPLLNIYKLMKADPIPFINLFFLLIFFVYKRKENFLEL